MGLLCATQHTGVATLVLPHWCSHIGVATLVLPSESAQKGHIDLPDDTTLHTIPKPALAMVHSQRALQLMTWANAWPSGYILEPVREVRTDLAQIASAISSCARSARKALMMKLLHTRAVRASAPRASLQT